MRGFRIYRVEYLEKGSMRWHAVGCLRARNEAGAIAQLMRAARHFPALVAVRAELAQ